MTSRGWCFTLNNYSTNEQMMLESIIETNDKVRYIIFGLEVGEQGTKHLQGYVELNSPQRLSAVKKILDRAHWEQRKGSRDQARTYCMKEGEWLEFGNWQSGGQGNRSDLEELMVNIKENKKTIDIIEQNPNVFAKHMKFAQKYTEVVEKDQTKNFRKVKVIVHYGDAGTGKTRAAHDEYPDIFTVNCGETFPFDGYEGEKEILLDDFYGNIKYHELLRILDGHQYKVNVKGSHRYARWETIVITSNAHPKEWYGVGLTPALARRLTTILEHKKDVSQSPPVTKWPGNTGRPLCDNIASGEDDVLEMNI